MASDPSSARADRQRPRAVQRAANATFVAALVIAWLAVRIWDAWELLDRYGIDRSLAGTVMVGLAGVTAVLYMVSAVGLLRGAEWYPRAITVLALPAALSAAYLFGVGATHTSQVGFGAGGLMALAVVAAVLIITVTRSARDADVTSWLSGRG